MAKWLPNGRRQCGQRPANMHNECEKWSVRCRTGAPFAFAFLNYSLMSPHNGPQHLNTHSRKTNNVIISPRRVSMIETSHAHVKHYEQCTNHLVTRDGLVSVSRTYCEFVMCNHCRRCRSIHGLVSKIQRFRWQFCIVGGIVFSNDINMQHTCIKYIFHSFSLLQTHMRRINANTHNLNAIIGFDLPNWTKWTSPLRFGHR